ncbi:hypothetical protein DPX16_15342 [Anabarilius grahami]|uniref:Uncharacterized protein n=1 Tax=Anabarilius grahami TaxID=495550 RepID=A0A3N0XW17_ANAGA|nr:hypothetical protein DPX16_15342 [Anabarilius grahami]
MKAGMESRPSAVSLKFWLRENRKWAVSIALLCEAEEACQVSLNPSKRQQEAASSRLSHYDTITRWHQTRAAMALTSRSLPVNLFGVQEHFGPVRACKSTIMTHSSDKTNVASADFHINREQGGGPAGRAALDQSDEDGKHQGAAVIP